MKTILLLIFLSISTLGNTATCSIQSIEADVLREELRDKGWVFENYDFLCNELKKNNLGILITDVSAISPNQTSAAATIQLFPLEINEKYKIIIPTRSTYNTIAYDIERTTSAERELRYENANYNLNEVTKNGLLEKMKEEIEEIRKRIK